MFESKLNSLEGIKEVYLYQKWLESELKAVNKNVDEIENEVLKLAKEENMKEGYVNFLSEKFKITVTPKYKILDEEKAYPFLKRHCAGLVKETVNHMSLQKNMKELKAVDGVLSDNGIAVIPETKVKLM